LNAFLLEREGEVETDSLASLILLMSSTNFSIVQKKAILSPFPNPIPSLNLNLSATTQCCLKYSLMQPVSAAFKHLKLISECNHSSACTFHTDIEIRME
jgi:hypothetical protein